MHNKYNRMTCYIINLEWFVGNEKQETLILNTNADSFSGYI